MNAKPEKYSISWHRREAEIFCRLSYTNQRQMFFYQTPGQPTPHIADRGVSTVTMGWIGDLNERITFRFQDGVGGFLLIDVCQGLP